MLGKLDKSAIRMKLGLPDEDVELPDGIVEMYEDYQSLKRRNGMGAARVSDQELTMLVFLYERETAASKDKPKENGWTKVRYNTPVKYRDGEFERVGEFIRCDSGMVVVRTQPGRTKKLAPDLVSVTND